MHRKNVKGWNEVKTNDSWSVFKIMGEFVDGFENLSKIGPCVSIFGSARTKPDHPHYKLTVDGYKQIISDVCFALDLQSPVVMGCSMGGRIVCHLALENPAYFRAMIALEGADKLEPYYNLEWLHRPDVHGGEIQAAFVSSQVAPTSPDEYRWETLWHYMQGGPGVFKGDLHFYWLDGDFDERSPQIDTKACPVYLMSG